MLIEKENLWKCRMDNLRILRLLRCPLCFGEMAVVEQSLVCSHDHRFPVTDGVPSFIPADLADSTKGSFDFKWEMLGDFGWDKATEKFRYDWYLKRYHWTDESLRAFIASRRTILDIGTGLGSQVAMYARMTKGVVVGVDVSRGVYQAQKRLVELGLRNTWLAQADLHHLPFKPGVFDFVASDQVLHHCPDTETAFKAIVPFVRSGGQVAFYVYKRKGDVREKCDDLLREFTTKMTPEECLGFADAVTLFGRRLSKQNLEMQRRIYWEMFKCFWSDQFDYRTNVMINFDWYHPRYAHRHTPAEVERWVRDAGLEMVVLDVGDSGISVRARKP